MDLAFGQTPWDLLPDEDLPSCLDQMLQALTEANSYIDVAYQTDRQHSPQFWDLPEGSGAKGRETIRQALERATRPRETRNDTLRTIFALHISIEKAHDLAAKCLLNQDSPWFQKLNQLLYHYNDAMREHLYKNFSRYAIDLLFEDRNGILVRKGWLVCPCCGDAIADGIRQINSSMRPGAIHKDVSRIAPNCEGTMRLYSWTDLNRPDFELETREKGG